MKEHHFPAAKLADRLRQARNDLFTLTKADLAEAAQYLDILAKIQAERGGD